LEWGWTRRTERSTRLDTCRLSLIPSRILIPPRLTVESVACGHVHAIALSTDSKKNKIVLSWGYNQKGQLGHGDTVTRERPEKIKGLPANVTMVACGEFHNLALTEDHKVYSWGSAASGQCGLGESIKTEVTTPTQILFFDTLPSDDYIVNVGCGSDHSLDVTKSGHVYTWGTGIQYQLCNGSCDGDVFEPALIKSKAFDSVYHCLKAVGGSSHSLFVGKKREEESKSTVKSSD